MWSNRISHFHLHPPPIMTSTVPPTPSHATMATHSQDSSGAAFDIAARRFFVQLSLGCGEAKCGHNLCASNPQRKKLGGQAAAIMAVQLASSYLSQDTSKLCLRIRIIPVETIQQSHSPFLDSLLVSAKYSLLSKPRMGRSASDAALPGSTLPSSEKHASPLKDTSAPDSSASIASQYKSTILCPCPAAGETATAPNDAEFARAKSLMDLPALFSATLPTFSGVKSVAGGTGAHAVEDSASPPVARSSQMKVRQLEKMGSSMSSLFEEMDAEVLSDHLDLSILETAVGRMKDSQAQQPSVANGAMHLTKETLSLLRTIKTVFSGANALNASFLHSEFDVESEDLGLDLHSLRKSFSIMLELEPKERFQHTLLSALETLVSSINLNIKKYATGAPKHLRVFIILLECPFLADPDQNGRILSKTCFILAALRTKSRSLLSKWLATYDALNFTRIMVPFSTYLQDHFFPQQRPDETLICCIRVLAMFSAANDTSKPRPLVSLSHFYSETLAKKLNFKDEYRIWKKTLDPGPSNSPIAGPHPKTIFTYFSYPFLFDPVSKTRILHLDAMTQMCLEYEEAVVHQAIVIHAQRFLQEDAQSVKDLEKGLARETNPYLVLEIRRAHLVRDVLDQVAAKQADLKKPLKIRFVGGGEEGMDAGGVQKEFFQVIVGLLLDPGFGMFVYDSETRYCWINGASLEPLRQFELVGTVLGLALYNGVILGVNFAPLLYKKLIGEEVSLEDVLIGFPALGKGLEMLLNWGEGDVEDVFCRAFEIEYEWYGQVKNYELVQGGRGIPVTNENRREYVDLYVKHYVYESVRKQFEAFRAGFQRVCGGPALKMCRAEELEMLICGTNELDFKDLEVGAKYDDGYDANHPVVKNFWAIAHAMSYERKKQLLNFVTASDRVPLKGLGNLVFVIQRNGPDTDRLPTALTCFGRLLLPEYSSLEKLEDRLVTAIENAKGFGLV